MKKNLLSFGLAILSLSSIAQSQRTSLFEEFTGETCGPCAQTNPGLNALLLNSTNAPKIIAIKWQVPIPTPPSTSWSLYQTNKAEIDYRYGAPSAGYGYASQASASSPITSQGVNSAPSGRIDGQHQWTFGAASDHPANMTGNVINTAYSVPSSFNINMQRAWNYNASAVNLTITVTATQNFQAVGNLIFRTVMVERLIQFSVQPGNNGEKTFEDVAIKSFPTLKSGTPLANTWTSGQSVTFTLECVMPSYTRKKEEVAMVGFIQDDGNRKVDQAARTNTASLPADGLAAVAAQVGVTCANQINPVITVANTGVSNITSILVAPFVDGIAATPVTLNTNISVGNTQNVPVGAITAPTTPGVHTFSYQILSLNGASYNGTGISNKVSFLVGGNNQATPVSEGFVGATFPPVKWALLNPDQSGASWSRSTLTGGYFQLPMQSMKYDFFSNTNIGDIDELYLPEANLLGSSAPDLTFDYAYAQRNGNENDKLDVLVSDNCGQTWSNVWSKAGSVLATSPSTVTAYIPDANDFAAWTTAQISLTGFNKSNVLVKFVTTNAGGNNLYVDNVNLIQNSPSIPTGISQSAASSFNVNIYPNPATGLANVTMTSVEASDVTISVINTLGQVVITKNTSLSEGTNTVSFDVRELATGIYNVVIDTKSGSVTRKLTVSK